MIIAVDFDGTLCENAWPAIGAPKQEVLNWVLDAKIDGHKVILWTCRTGERLEEAVKWCRAQGIIFDAVNDDIPSIKEKFGSANRKVFADKYLDDKNISLDGIGVGRASGRVTRQRRR